MKYISLLCVFLILLVMLGGCKSSSPNNTPESEINTSENIISEPQTDSSSSLQVEPTKERASSQVNISKEVTSSQPASSNNKNESTSKAEQTEPSKVIYTDDKELVSYYCDDINNSYIVAVAEKYNVDRTRLIAIIKRNGKTAGANVLEFSGKKDENGNLLMTADELVAVYNIYDSDGSIQKATGKITGNDGFTYFESLVMFMAVKDYIIPNLDEFKEKYPYNGQ